MRTVLDLIQEFATLNEAKTLSRGVLPPDRERRWTELKRFYDILMSQDGLAERPVARYTSAQIREKVPARARLRVRTEMEIVVMGAGEVHHARVDNLSCGGALLLCEHGFDVGTELTLQIASFIRGDALLPTKGTVVWGSENGSSSAFRFQMGVEFAGVGDAAHRSLDTLVVDSLETKLLCLRPEVLGAEFVQREQLSLG